jgi:hypothetical protein
MGMGKYEFIGETKQIEIFEKIKMLHRIRAIVDFGNVKAGDVGGWIEKETNLSCEGNAWVSENAIVHDEAVVDGNAVVRGKAIVGNKAKVGGEAEVEGHAWVGGHAVVRGHAEVGGEAVIGGEAVVEEKAEVGGEAEVGGHAWVGGEAVVGGTAIVRGYAEVLSTSHVLVVGPISSRDDFITFYRDKDNEITVSCGCFLGKLDRFLEKVTQKHGNSKYAQVYCAAAEMAKLQIDLSRNSSIRSVMKINNDLISRSALLDRLRGNVLIDVTSELEKAIQEQPTVQKGDIVWELCKCDDGEYRIFPMKVKQVVPYGSIRWVQGKEPIVWNLYAESDCTYMYKSFYEIGKTVFLTQAEAEVALEKMKKSTHRGGRN